MWRVAFKSVLAHKLRLVAVSLAVVLGVALMSGTLVLTGTMNKNFDDLFSTAYEHVDVVVRGHTVIEGSMESEAVREDVDQSLVSQIKTVDGVGNAVGMISGTAAIVDEKGDVVSTGGAPSFGSNWVDDPINPYLINQGNAPRADDEVVVDRGTAKKADIQVGDTISLLISGLDPIKVKVSGIATFGSSDSAAGASEVFFTEKSAWQYLTEQGKYQAIGVAAKDDVSQEQLKRNIAAALSSSNVDVITGEEAADEASLDIKEALKYFNYFLMPFAIVTLVVGVLIIYNVFSVLVAQRSKENALLRAIGASRRQVGRTVVIEALFVGVIGGALGLLAGVGLAVALKALLSLLGIDLPASGVVVPSSAVISSFAVGVIASLVSSWLPARRAGRIPPIAALREVAIDRSGTSVVRLIIGLLLLAIGVVVMMLGLFGDLDKAYIPVGIGALVTFISLVVLAPNLAIPVVAVLGVLPAKTRGIAGKLAGQNARRNPKRTAASASALMIGVGLVGFMFIMTSSIKATISDALDRSFAGDYVINGGQTGLSPTFVSELSSKSELSLVTGISSDFANVNGDANAISGVDPKAITQIISPEIKEGSFEDLQPDQIAVSAGSSHAIGEVVQVVFPDGTEKSFKVEAIFESDLMGAYAVSHEAFNAAYDDVAYWTVFAKKASGVENDKARQAVDAVAADYPGVEVSDQAEFKEEISSQLNQLLGLLVGLLTLAVIVALIGIVITLLLAIHERTRELGLLRAVGMTRRQLRVAIRWEAIITALFGTLLGLAVAIFFGVSIVSSLGSGEDAAVVSIPVGSLLAIGFVGAFAGVIAAILPARRASRLNILKAIASE